MPKMEMPDKLSNTDHDALIELKTEFKAFVRQYSLDMKDLKDGTAKTLIDHDLAIKKNNEEIEIIKAEQRSQGEKWRLFLWLLAPIYVALIGILVGKVVEWFS